MPTTGALRGETTSCSPACRPALRMAWSRRKRSTSTWRRSNRPSLTSSTVSLSCSAVRGNDHGVGLAAGGNVHAAEHAGLQRRVFAGTEGIPGTGDLNNQRQGTSLAVQAGLPTHDPAVPGVVAGAALPPNGGCRKAVRRGRIGTRHGREVIRRQRRQPAEFLHGHGNRNFHRVRTVQGGDFTPDEDELAEVKRGLHELAVGRRQQARLAELQFGLLQLGARHLDSRFGLLDARPVQRQLVFDALHRVQGPIAHPPRTVALAR